MKGVIKLISVLSCVLVSVMLVGCGKTSSKGDNSSTDNTVTDTKPTTIYTCTIYSDNNGELKNANGERVCAIKIYSRGEPLNLYFSGEVDWCGVELKEVYLKVGNVYDEYPYSYKIDELIPLGTYKMSSEGENMFFEFFALDEESQNKFADKKTAIKEDDKPSNSTDYTSSRTISFNNLEDIKKNIDGTIWTHTEPLKGRNQFWYRIKFNNGKVSFCRAYPSDGKWDFENESNYDYTIEEDRYLDTGEKYYYISFGQFRFIPSTSNLIIYYPNDRQYYAMRMRDYKWD